MAQSRASEPSASLSSPDPHSGLEPPVLFMTAVLNLPNAVTLKYHASCCGDPQPKNYFLLRNCNFAPVMNRNVNSLGDGGLPEGPQGRGGFTLEYREVFY